MFGFLIQVAEEILRVVQVIEALLLHRARLSRWVHILCCLVVSELHELAEATLLTK